MESVLVQPRQRRFRFVLDEADALGPLLLAPAILYILLLVAVPFFLALYYSVSAYNLGSLSFSFVGLRNFVAVTQSEIFRRALLNTFVFTIGSNLLALVLGKIAALLLLREFPGRTFARCLLILPWAVPVALAAISIIVVQAWRLFPFAAIIFLAGLTSVPKAVLDASYIDGAGYWRRTFQIVLPMILPIMMVAMLFGLVFTFTDMSVVYLLTKGGPTNSTQVLGSLAFQVGILSGDVGRGAAISLYLFPFLLLATFCMLRFLRRREV